VYLYHTAERDRQWACAIELAKISCKSIMIRLVLWLRESRCVSFTTKEKYYLFTIVPPGSSFRYEAVKRYLCLGRHFSIVLYRLCNKLFHKKISNLICKQHTCTRVSGGHCSLTSINIFGTSLIHGVNIQHFGFIV